MQSAFSHLGIVLLSFWKLIPVLILADEIVIKKVDLAVASFHVNKNLKLKKKFIPIL